MIFPDFRNHSSRSRSSGPTTQPVGLPVRRLCSVAVVCCVLSGCGEPHASVHGVVTWNGQPLPSGVIVFISQGQDEDGNQPTVPLKIHQGRYGSAADLDLLPGQHRVEIRSLEKTGRQRKEPVVDSAGRLTNQMQDVDVLRQCLPARFNDESNLMGELAPGENLLNFELIGK